MTIRLVKYGHRARRQEAHGLHHQQHDHHHDPRSTGLAFILIISLLGLLSILLLKSFRQILADVLSTVKLKALEQQPHEQHHIKGQGSDKRISYRLHRDNFFTNRYNLYYRCNNRQPLSPDLDVILNFTTTISTDLKILVMGDSVGVQLAQGLQEAASPLFGSTASSTNDIKNNRTSHHQPSGESRHERRIQSIVDQRDVMHYSWGAHEGVFAQPTDGGGSIAGYRITGLWQRRRENGQLPNAPGGGWTRDHIASLKKYSYMYSNDNKISEEKQGNFSLDDGFDTMIVRIPHGWINTDSITVSGLNEVVGLAKEIFNVSSIIFMSLYPINNVMTAGEFESILPAKNRLIRDFVDSYQERYHGLIDEDMVTTAGADTSSTTTADKSKSLYVNVSGEVMAIVPGVNMAMFDVGNLSYELLERNACHLGMINDDNIDIARMNVSVLSEIFIGHRVTLPRTQHTASIAQVCAEKVPHLSQDCPRNSFALDGIHWCSETMNGRMHAGMACLLGCLHNDKDVDEDSAQNTPDRRQSSLVSSRHCERTCNEQFMSLKPIPSLQLENLITPSSAHPNHSH